MDTSDGVVLKENRGACIMHSMHLMVGENSIIPDAGSTTIIFLLRTWRAAAGALNPRAPLT